MRRKRLLEEASYDFAERTVRAIGRTILIAVSESCCSPAKENRLTGAKVIGAWTQHSLAFMMRRAA